MSIASFQTGTVSLGTSDLSNTATLGTTVTQSNSILIVSVHGANNDAANQAVRVDLNSAGTTITATRQGTSTAVTVQFIVIESTSFTVQHKTVTISSTSQNETISSVDTAYSFVIGTGVERSGGTRGSDDFVALEITTSTNVNQQVQATGAIISYQVVEMSSSEITSVQLVKITQNSTAEDTTISSVDTSKCLMFASGRWNAGSGGTAYENREMPRFELTSSTNLRSSVNQADSQAVHWVYVVEFANMSVTHNTASPTGTTTTEVLGGAPTYGVAVINGLYGRYVTADSDADDDALENMFSASLSGSTWTFTRGASTQTAQISYTVCDFDDLFSGAPPTGNPKFPFGLPLYGCFRGPI